MTNQFNKYILILLLVIPAFIYSQKIYTVDYQSQSDIKVFVVEYSSQSDKKIYFVEYEYQSDLKVYFVKYKSQSGWRNNKKKHLLY